MAKGVTSNLIVQSFLITQIDQDLIQVKDQGLGVQREEGGNGINHQEVIADDRIAEDAGDIKAILGL